MLAQVDGGDVRQARTAETAGQGQVRVAALFDLHPVGDRRRGGGEQRLVHRGHEHRQEHRGEEVEELGARDRRAVQRGVSAPTVRRRMRRRCPW